MIQGSNRISKLHRSFREKAIRLRSRGLSYNEILEKVPVAKSTISLWCRDIQLTSEQKKRLEEQNRKGGLEGIKAIQTMFWEKRCNAFLEGIKLSYELAINNPKFVAGLMLYWAEGTKKNSTAVTNSDPRIIKFMTIWLKDFFNIKPEQLVLALHLHPEQNEGKIRSYWIKMTNIPATNFRKSYIKPKGSGYKKNILQHGTAKLVVRTKGSTYLLYKLLGAINGFLKLATNERIEPGDWMVKLPYARLIKSNFNMRP